MPNVLPQRFSQSQFTDVLSSQYQKHTRYDGHSQFSYGISFHLHDFVIHEYVARSLFSMSCSFYLDKRRLIFVNNKCKNQLETTLQS